MSATPPNLTLRAPALLFGAIGLALLFVIALLFATFAVSGFRALDALAAHGLITPASIGTLLAAFSLGPRARRGIGRGELISRSAAAYAVAGAVWPLSFGIAVLLQGDTSSALTALLPALAGLAIGAIGGALGGAIAGAVVLKAAPTS